MFSKSFIFAALVGLADMSAYATIISTCTKDACLAVVDKGHHPGGPRACRSFLMATVTPGAVVDTTTVTRLKTISTTTTQVDFTTSTSTVDSPTTVSTESQTVTSTYSYHKRTMTNTPVTNSPTAVPKYASKVCTDVAEYSSACSCAGATKTTTTVPTPTSHTTITKHRATTELHTDFETSSTVVTTSKTNSVTALTTVSTSYATNTAYPTSCNTTGTFLIQVLEGPDNVVGKYAAVTSGENGIIEFGSRDNATPFTRDSSCTLEAVDESFYANTNGDRASSLVFFNSRGKINEIGADVIKAYIFSDGIIAVNVPDNIYDPTVLQVEDDSDADFNHLLVVGTSVDTDDHNYAVTLVAIPQ